MSKYLIIDKKMRKQEKEYLKSIGYETIEVESNDNLYDEISSHVDIFACKINDKIILENSLYKKLLKYNVSNIYLGKSLLTKKYPFDIPYNVCQIGKYAIHNFEYTDTKVLDVIKKEGLEKINVKQGYSKCSIAVVDDKSAITTDKKIADKLKMHGIDVLLFDKKLDIKLLDNKNNYSKMSGFIGGATSKLNDKFIVFGDVKNIDKEGKIKTFVESKNLKLIDFKNLDVIDYGGILNI